MSVVAPQTQMDLTRIDAAERGPLLLTWFDSLRPQEALVLSDAAPAPDLLALLQRERKGQFEWSPRPLAGGFGVEVLRRDVPRGSLRGIREALAWDHDRLDALERQAFEARTAGDLRGAEELFGRFRAGLERHISFEEEILFPAFEQGTGMPPTAGPTAVMRDEHQEILEALKEIAGTIGSADAQADAIRRVLHIVLQDHNIKEERILYPTTDSVLRPERADRLVADIQAHEC